MDRVDEALTPDLLDTLEELHSFFFPPFNFFIFLCTSFQQLYLLVETSQSAGFAVIDGEKGHSGEKVRGWEGGEKTARKRKSKTKKGSKAKS